MQIIAALAGRLNKNFPERCSFGTDARKAVQYPSMAPEKKTTVEIFADGACSGNPGIGGFGAILRSGAKELELGGFEAMTTNNRMELLGVITALEALRKPCAVTVTTDSKYVVQGMTEWISGWLRNGWRNSQKKEVMNRDLWERLLAAAQPHTIPGPGR